MEQEIKAIAARLEAESRFLNFVEGAIVHHPPHTQVRWVHDLLPIATLPQLKNRFSENLTSAYKRGTQNQKCNNFPNA